MEVDYHMLGKRIARRRKKLNFTQAKVAEMCEISEQYMSNIERAVSIPSTEVIMRLAIALNTTPDEFLVGTARYRDEKWKGTAEKLRGLDEKRLETADRFISWLLEQDM